LWRRGVLWISQLQQLDSGEDEGKRHMDFLWFVNLVFYKIFSLTLTLWLKTGKKKKEKNRKPHSYIFTLKPLNSGTEVYLAISMHTGKLLSSKIIPWFYYCSTGACVRV